MFSDRRENICFYQYRYGYAKQSHSKKLSLISDKNLKIILYYIVA
jgi:hypothetical protein